MRIGRGVPLVCLLAFLVIAPLRFVHADVTLLTVEGSPGSTALPGYAIVFHGEIQQGDHETFLAIVRGLSKNDIEDRAYPIHIILDSPGGDVIEAMRIGSSIRNLGLGAKVPRWVLFNEWDLKRGYLQNPAIPIAPEDWERHKHLMRSVKCLSACVFIFISGVERDVGWAPISYNHPRSKRLGRDWADATNREESAKESSIGIHRPSFHEKHFSGLNSTQAREKYAQLEQTVRAWLQEMGLGERWISEMFAVSSNDIRMLSYGDILSIGLFEKAWEEWLIANCGFSSTDAALVAMEVSATWCIASRSMQERKRLRDAYLK